MLDHSPKTHGVLLQKKPALTKINGAHLLKWLAAFCMLDYVGAATPFTTPAPFPTNCGCSAEIKAMEERIRHEFYEQLNAVRECSGCMSPSPPPPSPESPPPPPSTPPPSPKPPCATPVDFALVLDESGSMKQPLPDGSMEGPNGLKAFAKRLVRHATIKPR